MPYFNYNNKSCYYEEHGEGIPIIFLHGNTASSNMFYDVIETFTKNYKVILIDFLGHGRSDRVKKLISDLWHDEALQVIAFLEQTKYKKTHLIGSSGGALVAIYVALERPDLVYKIIADSFQGEFPIKEFTQNLISDRATSKLNEGAQRFYFSMHGSDWESIVDNDTLAIYEHAMSIRKFFHKPLSTFNPEILLTGSKEDEFMKIVNPDFFSIVYSGIIDKIGHGEMYIFDKGGHPALLSNKAEFSVIAKEFLKIKK